MSQIGATISRDTIANAPMGNAMATNHSDAVGGFGVIDAGGRSILTVTVASGAQTIKTRAKTARVSPPNFSQPDFVNFRPNTFAHKKFRL